ncbi:Serine palmitoyltransferase 2 like protein [Verticillium longisporum]|nr:Serine palmitoyltransferase 2 like protein [Verticillium longisporum]
MPHTQSDKNKEQSAQQALLAMQQGNMTPSAMALPTISLSTASAGEPDSNLDSTTLFSPPSAAESEKKRRADSQFAPLSDPSHLYVSMHHGEPLEAPIVDDPAYYFLITTYISYLFLILLGHIRDFFGKRFGNKKHYHCVSMTASPASPPAFPAASSLSSTAPRPTSTVPTTTPAPPPRRST